MTPGTLATIQYAQATIIVITFVASLAFVALYSAVARWWLSPWGRNIVALDSALALTLLPSVIHHTFGVNTVDSPFFAWFTLGSFALVPVVIVWRMAILLGRQLRRRPSPDRSDPPSPQPTPEPRRP